MGNMAALADTLPTATTWNPHTTLPACKQVGFVRDNRLRVPKYLEYPIGYSGPPCPHSGL